MRATRSDSLILEDCRVPESAVLFRSDDTRRFRHDYLNWFWGSYTAVYLGIAVAAYDELRRTMHARQPQGYAQSLAYHPDVRRHVAELSADLEAARLITYRSAWLSDTQGPTAETTAALYRAKYVVGEAVSRITRVALTLGGAHGIFKGSRLEQLFRDGAIGADPAAAGGLLSVEHGDLRAGIGPDGGAAADQARVAGTSVASAVPVIAKGQSNLDRVMHSDGDCRVASLLAMTGE